jgi:uncharacterized protein YegL
MPSPYVGFFLKLIEACNHSPVQHCNYAADFQHGSINIMHIHLLRCCILFCLTLGSMQLNAQATAPIQGQVQLDLTVKDNQGRPMAQTPVEFVEQNSRQRIQAVTDAAGQVKQHFASGRFWQINILQVVGYFSWQFEVVPGKNFTITRIVTYDYDRFERETRPAVDRRTLQLKLEPQKVAVDAAPAAGMGIVKVELKKPNGLALSNFPVAITCYALQKTYTAATNPAGIATFQVPLGNEYEIDIDGIHSYNYIDLPNTPGYRSIKNLVYEPTVIVEKTVRDTTTQQLDPAQEGTSGRTITTITFKGGPDGVWRNEPVFLEVLGETRVYKAMTNQNGEARFLIPKGKKYMIHGRFQYNLDVVDLSRRRGIGYSNKSLFYTPLEKYQYPDRYIPKPEDLIVEAFENFLRKQYPAPAPGKKLGLQGKWSSAIQAGSENAVLNISITTAEAGEGFSGSPMNLCFVLDNSGSMAGEERIDRAKKSMAAFISQLRPSDVVSIVVFDDEAVVIIPAQQIGADKALFLKSITRIEADGGTQIANGLAAGYKELMKQYNAKRINRLILLSDGYGAEPVDETIAVQKPYNAKGIECTTVGVGEDYNVALLSQLATPGGGMITHVGDDQDMEAVFLKELSSMLYPVASNLELEILYNKHLEYRQLYGFPLQERAPGRLKLKLRHAYSGLNQLAFVRFKVIDPKPGIQDEPVTLRLRYQDPITGAMMSEETKVPLVWNEKAGELELLFDQNERKLYAIAVMNQSLKVMSDRFHLGDLPGAQAALEDGIQNLRKVYPESDDADVTALAERLQQYLDIIVHQKK